MRNIQNFNIVSTFLCLWLAVYLTTSLEQYLACFFILTVGLMHGSNDIKIIKRVYNNSSISYYKTLILYIMVVLFGALMFFLIPKIALILFILVSGFHFGEQHFHEVRFQYKWIKKSLYVSYGCAIIFLLLYTNAQESIEIISQITGESITINFLMVSLISSLMVFVSCFVILYKSITNPIRELFNILVFFIVFKTASLLWAFAIYFVLWHSLPSVLDQVKYLFKEVNKRSVLEYVKSSAIYWIVSVVGLFLLLNFLVKQEDLFYAVFFSFLAAITFPHVIVMTKIFKH
ncbi:Brp/Blh family beta-carotene 15,15'-dioxygenase [Winogradskyella jejuensis]|uniref:Probable beta-carotene 15,15'-dioxygenase n=1 Tax=Winogradskyella jejuensis TaxID=1089305 RepID=A0A1M5RUJ0_9FLAO|nr:Brp/Blh family beta-carotene 15,15'-dioxygenase [Winogradskyella jejuensis]SHH29850.1 beta-carotene 15,15'-monooxygenase, Brp/Blh family [Winogradskyella jejuensis]